MDFFERQDKARRHTKLLVFYFSVAIILLVLAVYTVVLLIFGATGSSSARDSFDAGLQLELLFWSALTTLSVIVMGSVFKTMQLARGGSAVAELFHGRLISSATREAEERKLLNVVEEMAIASGVPVPQVYVLDAEPGINAFAAGHSPSDAAISVTRGCMTLLSRDELQGVVAHEFSHILNGDMRLNLRLMGLVFGILCLTIIGRILLRTRGRRNPLPILGLALIVIGWIGVLFGRLIQAAVSRQREILADAAAVQFTRNPAGLAGALKKIGGLTYGSRLESAHAEEASHFFFANGLGESFFGFATHPPLIERIRALDPGFDGKFPSVITAEPMTPPSPAAAQSSPLSQIAPAVVAQEAVLENIGSPTPRHLRYAADLQQRIAPVIEQATHDPLGASALVCAFLLSEESSIRAKQLAELTRALPEAICDETERLWPAAQNLSAQVRIPMIDLALPALRRLSPQQFAQLQVAVKTLIATDSEIDLFEYMLQKIFLRHLERYFYPTDKSVTQFYALRPLVNDCSVLLSATAYAGQQDVTQARIAFAAGAKMLSRIAGAEIAWLTPDACNLSQLDKALERLSQAVHQIKKMVLDACAQTVAADGLIQEREAELLRAIADALDCPMPPFVEPPPPAAPISQAAT